MPELRLVVLALQDRLAYGPTFEAALAGLFGGTAPAADGRKPAADADTDGREGAEAARASRADLRALIATPRTTSPTTSA